MYYMTSSPSQRILLNFWTSVFIIYAKTLLFMFLWLFFRFWIFVCKCVGKCQNLLFTFKLFVWMVDAVYMWESNQPIRSLEHDGKQWTWCFIVQCSFGCSISELWPKCWSDYSNYEPVRCWFGCSILIFFPF